MSCATAACCEASCEADLRCKGLGKSILEDEGFSNERYKYGYAIESKPSEELVIADHTNKVVKASDGRLAQVPEKRLYGCLAKNHLVLFLQALKNGKIRWDHDPSRPMAMVRPDQELKNALDLGLDMWIIGWEAQDEDPEGIKALVASDNLEAARAKADSEVDIMSILQLNMSKLSGTTAHTEAELRKIQLKTGNIWNQHQVHAMYNFMKGIGEMHFELLKRFFFLMVNTSKIRTPCPWFAEIHKLGNCPWAKLSLIVAQYSCDTEHYGNRVNGVFQLKYIDPKRALEFRDTEALHNLDNFVAQLVSKYAPGKLPEIDEGAATRALFLAISTIIKDGFWRFQGKILIKRPTLMEPIYKKAEEKLRKKFESVTLPEPIYPADPQAAKKAKDGDETNHSPEPVPALDDAPPA